MARLPYVSDASEDELLQELLARIHSRGEQVPNLYRAIAHAPRMLKAWTDFTWPLRFEAVSPRSLRELLVMRVAHVTSTPYEWAHHWPMALSSGVRPEQLEDLANWKKSDEFSEEERAALDYADAITRINVDDATFDRMRRYFAPEVIIELTLLASFYTHLARVVQALHIELEPQYEQFAPQIRG